MGSVFRLEIECEVARVRFTLSDEHARQLAAHEVDVAAQPPVMWNAVLDTRAWIDRSARTPAEGRDRLRELGRYLGDALLGSEILGRLGGGAVKTLAVRTAGADPLAAQLRRVPWELARGATGASLRERNVVTRQVVGAWTASTPETLAIDDGEPIRILLVFAEAPGSRPLAMRQERELILETMFGKVFPHRLVKVNVACHGVTRRRLREQITNAAGFHVVHWSGHGRENALELSAEPGESNRITGDELVQLIVGAGGFIPRLVFLSACRSGAADSSSTGVATALLDAGVTQVVAMRYDISDPYARALACAFYRHLLVDDAHHPADQALALARADVAGDRAHEAEYHVVDHETPAVFGGPPLRLVPHRRRSPQLDRRRPRPYPLLPGGSKDLDPPDNFVGRSVELSHLYRQWFDAPDAPRVTVLRGLAGMGKTAMAAEMIHLWHGGFDLVLCFQSKGRPLHLDELYGDLDRHLELESAGYRERVADHPSERIYLAPAPLLTGPARYTRMANNLIVAMAAERLLLVLDNFETNLASKQVAGYSSRDPEWDALLQLLARELPSTPASRAIVTTRNSLAAFAGLADRVITVPLGPLIDDDAALFVQGLPALHALWISADAARREFALRVMRVSGGHPLLLRCFGGLAAKGAAELAAALDALQRSGYELAPGVLADGVASPELVVYLREVTATALDELIGRLGWEARRLLWVLARSEGSVPQSMLPLLWPIARRDEPSPFAPAIAELLDTGLVTLHDEVYSTHPLSNERIHAWMASHTGDTGGLTPQDVDGEAGEMFSTRFKQLRGGITAEATVEIGRRALRLLARGQRWTPLGTLAGEMAIDASGTLASALIADLSAIVDGVPETARWRARAALAPGLEMARRRVEYIEPRVVGRVTSSQLMAPPVPSSVAPLLVAPSPAASSPAVARMIRTVVHFMDEAEHALARELMPGAQFAAAFCCGDASPEVIAKLQDAGLMVVAIPDDEPAAALESAAESAELGLESAPQMRGPGDAPPAAGGPGDAPQMYRLTTRGPLLSDGHEALARHGVEVLERMPGGAFSVRMSSDAAAVVRGMDFVRGLSGWEPPASAPPAPPIRSTSRLESLEVMEPRRPYTVQVPAAESAALLAWFADHGIVVVRRIGERIRIEATEDEIARLRAQLDPMSWVEPYEPPRLHCDVARGLAGVDAVAAPPLGLTGAGELVAIADTGLDATHPDFQGRIERLIARGRPPDDTTDPHGHGTHVAGTAVGDGTGSNGAIRGVAPGARLVFQSLLDAGGDLGGLPEPLDALFDEAYRAGARIHLDSWGTASRSTYTLASADVDRYVHAHRDFLVVLSAGNAGSNAANTIAPPTEIEWTTIDAPATCKNAIVVGASRSSRTVGGTADRTYNEAFPGAFPHPPWRDERVSGDPEAIAAFSSRGPTDDRRIKPDLVAPGTDILAARSAAAPAARFTGTSPDHPGYAFMSGTSMAAPLVAGGAALVREYYRRTRSHAPSAALVKATLINGTRWLSSACAVASPGGRPNFHQGFGALRLDTCLPRPGSNERLEFVDDVALGLGDAARFDVDLLGDTELRICLAWTDPPARAVQNNLDLLCRVTSVEGKHTNVVGNAGLAQRVTPLDADNNVEVIRIAKPDAGRLRINVTAKSFVTRSDRQDFALVVLGSLVGPLQRAER